MDIRQLRYFVSAAEHRHFTRGAEACFVSQPALSQQIQALERELGIPLFDRLSTGVELTTAGNALRPHAESILRQVENARVAVEEVAGTVRGELSLAAVHTANLALVIDALASFRERHPAVSVRIYEEKASDVVGAVLSGRVNLGIAYLPVAEDLVEATPLYEEEWVLVVPEDHELAGRILDVATLAELPLIVPPEGFCLRAGVDQALARAGGTARIVAELSAVETMCEAVRAGLGVTLLPSVYEERAVRSSGLAIARLEEPSPSRTVGAVRHAHRHPCLASRAFIETLREHASRLRSNRTPREPSTSEPPELRLSTSASP